MSINPSVSRLNQEQRSFHEKLNKLFDYEDQQNYQMFIDHLKFLDSRMVFHNCLVILVNFNKAKAHYVSSGVQQIFGYSPQEYIDGDLFFHRGHTEKQPGYLVNTASYINHFRHLTTGRQSRNFKFFSAGSFFQHKNGSQRRVLSKYRVDNVINGVLPEMDVIIHYDVTELMKGENFWVYQEKTMNDVHYARFYADEKIEKYLITPREKEILVLIGKGKTSKEIGIELSISPDTVSQHRKNMIRRTSARDSSALIQLCKICELL